MTNVLVLETYADHYIDALSKDFPLARFHGAKDLTALPDDLASMDVLLAFGIAIDDAMMQRASGLKWIQSLATGVDHFLKSPGLRPHTILTSARGIHGPAMSETVAFLMLSASRNAPQFVRQQDRREWRRAPWSLLHGKTALVCGVGLSSTSVATLLKAFGMTVIGASRTPRRLEAFDEIVSTDELAKHAGRVDYLINVLPAAPANRHIIGADVFAAMKPTARFINVGRGETVDEAALIAALAEGRIAGAGLDVFDVEPLPQGSPLWTMPNVLVTPHVAGFFTEYEEFVLPLVRDNMALFFAGRTDEMRNIIPH